MLEFPPLAWKEVTFITLWRRRPEFEIERSLGKEHKKGTWNREGGPVLEEGMGMENSKQPDYDCISNTIGGTKNEDLGMEPKEKWIKEVECCGCNRLTKSLNNITHWSLLTDLSLQKSDIVNVKGNIPELSFSKSDYSRLQSIVGLKFPMKTKILKLCIRFSQE